LHFLVGWCSFPLAALAIPSLVILQVLLPWLGFFDFIHSLTFKKLDDSSLIRIGVASLN
jgi:hypothetical protein